MMEITPDLIDLIQDLRRPISDLKLGTREYNALTDGGVYTTLDLLVSLPYLHCLRGIGKKGYYSILSTVEALGFDVNLFEWKQQYQWGTFSVERAYREWKKDYYKAKGESKNDN